MSAGLFLDTTSSSAASDIVSDAESGTLWGVDLGTTTKIASYSDKVFILATRTRVDALVESRPEGVEDVALFADMRSFTDGAIDEQVWYLYGVASSG